MKIFVAGNIAEREREENNLLRLGLIKRRLFSFHYLSEKSMLMCFKLYQNENLSCWNTRNEK